VTKCIDELVIYYKESNTILVLVGLYYLLSEGIEVKVMSINKEKMFLDVH
jgi:hypothetical protein